MATRVDIPHADPIAVDPNAVINNGTEILEDPATVVAAHGISVASDILPEAYANGALSVPNTTLHRRTVP